MLSANRLRRLATFAVVGLLLTNCGKGDGATAPPPVVARVTLSGAPQDGLILVGQTAQLVAAPVDSKGTAITGKSISWSSSDASVVTAGSTGLVAATGAGFATITATTDNQSATLAVVVREPIVAPAISATQPTITTLLRGAAVVTIPPGATAPGATLSVGPAAAASFPFAPELLSGTTVTFGPDGLQFTTPITLSLKYDPTGLSAAEQVGLAVYVLQNGDWVEVQGSVVAPGNLVTAPLAHFSTYGVLKRSAPASAAIGGGNNQSATVGTVLPLKPSVVVLDAKNRPVKFATVVFAAATGGGTVSGATQTTDDNGVATVGGWTLGAAAGVQTLTATVSSLPVLTISATATPPVTPVIALSNTTAAFTFIVGGGPPSPQSISVSNAGANTLTNLSVGAVTYSSGATGWLTSSLSGPTAPATLTLGISAGSAPSGTYTATLPLFSPGASNSPKSVTVTLTVIGPASVTVLLGTPALSGNALTTATATVRDQFSNVMNVPVAWTASNPLVARVTSAGSVQALGAGSSQITASVGGVSGGSSLAVTAAPQAYNIQVRFIGTMTPARQQAFTNAAAKWMQIIRGGVTPIPVNASLSSCGITGVSINETINALVIYAAIDPIDGPGGILGAAGPCLVRSGSLLPIVGFMHFDVADVASLEANGTFPSVILHEMGHVLGFGTIWSDLGLIQGEGGSDPIFTGTDALWAFPAIGFASYSGRPVPVENSGGPGTRDGHWRESVLHRELMTGYVEAPGVPMPLSALTIGSLLDLGYIVDFSQADPMSFALNALGAAVSSATKIPIVEGVMPKPVVIDVATGRPR